MLNLDFAPGKAKAARQPRQYDLESVCRGPATQSQAVSSCGATLSDRKRPQFDEHDEGQSGRQRFATRRHSLKALDRAYGI